VRVPPVDTATNAVRAYIVAEAQKQEWRGYREGSMKPLLIFLPLLLAGCDGATVLLVHPKTGEQITCRGYFPVVDSIQASTCATRYEALGFIRAENLTPQQKEQISKPTAATTGEP
jgi:hypothetical protein